MTGPTEATTRQELIDPALKKAGWDVNNPDRVGIEIPVDGFDAAAWHRLEGKLREARQPYEVDLPSGISDYVLKQPNGQIIAVVEAKRTSISPALAEAQTEFYVEEIEKMQGFRPVNIQKLMIESSQIPVCSGSIFHIRGFKHT